MANCLKTNNNEVSYELSIQELQSLGNLFLLWHFMIPTTQLLLFPWVHPQLVLRYNKSQVWKHPDSMRMHPLKKTMCFLDVDIPKMQKCQGNVPPSSLHHAPFTISKMFPLIRDISETVHARKCQQGILECPWDAQMSLDLGGDAHKFPLNPTLYCNKERTMGATPKPIVTYSHIAPL